MTRRHPRGTTDTPLTWPAHRPGTPHPAATSGTGPRSAALIAGLSDAALRLLTSTGAPQPTLVRLEVERRDLTPKGDPS